MLTSQGFYGAGFPITGSHEAGGTVYEVGEGVQNLKVGDRVIALNQVHQCGELSFLISHRGAPKTWTECTGECWDCRKADPA